MRTAAAIALALGLAAGAARADMVGLVIGIDAYRHINPLQGAVNDARDIADSLKAAGARDVRLLLDGAADRDSILAAWKDLLAKTGPNDVIVFSYAGHGGQEAERVKGSEADGLDETFLLAGFQPQGAGNYQRIADDEVAEMLRQAAPRRVLFIADACHSGTMTRAFDGRTAKLGTRAATYGPIEDDTLPPPTREATQAEQSDAPHVTFFAAVSEHELAPEVRIDGKPRGALSWAFARALRGNADRDGDGQLSKDELEIFIRETVRMKLEGRQHPQVQPSGRSSATLVPAASGPRPVRPAFAGLPPLKPVALRVTGPGGVGPAGGLTGVGIVADAGAAARLVWDRATGDVVTANGDLAASLKDAPTDAEAARRLQAIADKWALIERLEQVADLRSLTLSLTPGDSLHRVGSTVTVNVGGNEATYFTFLNLASDGTVNFLYPVSNGRINDPLQIPAGGPYRLTLKVEPPFGADHFVAIATPVALTDLHRELAALDGKPAAAAVGELLARHLTGKPVELGWHGLFTGP